MEEKIVFILDFDGTFYSGENVFSLVDEHVNKHRRKLFPKISDEQYKSIIEKYPEFEKVTNGGEIAAWLYKLKKEYKDLKILPRHFYEWQTDYPDPIILEGAQLVNSDLLKILCALYAVYVVSNSSIPHLKIHMRTMGVDYRWFKALIANKFTLKDLTKKHYYKCIMQKENVKSENVIVVGDSLKSDIEPAKKLNMQTYLIKNAEQTESIIRKWLKK